MSAAQLRNGKRAEFLSELKNSTMRIAYDSSGKHADNEDCI